MSEFSDRFIREKECERLTGLSRTTRWRMAQNGEFPTPVPLSGNAVGWRLSTIMAWMAKREAPAPSKEVTRPTATTETAAFAGRARQ